VPEYDAVVVGAGPNGLTAAAVLAGAGRSVLVVEGADRVGGGTRSEELTLPGVRHDVCSAVHPLGAASPAFAGLKLDGHGLEWAHPEIPMAHPVAPGRTGVLHRSLDATVAGLGPDGPAYRRVAGWIAEHWPRLRDQLLGPIPRLPRHPFTLARFGLDAALPATVAARLRLRTEEGRALLAGSSAHSFLPLTRPLTASFGWLLLATAHLEGWPFARGGSQSVADALAASVRARGGHIETGRMVGDLGELPSASAVLLDLTPTGLARVAGDRLPPAVLRRVRRYRYGPAAFKLDYALDGPVPWSDPMLSQAGTVHLGGTVADVAASEAAAWHGREHPEPFLLIAQPSVADPGRAPAGTHVLWVYAHVPHNSTTDFTARIEARIERFAPGFGERVLARHVIRADGWEERNPNYVGGDIAGGAHTIGQLIFRPLPGLHPYGTGIPGVYLCSSSTPPGAGVHGMCGYHAARAALGRELA
jgi:phytoene dehydrogenase-like protein